ncbi:Uu.00g082390.m01.CDS01 [Anthostomella pinea]|uniref:Uu.00g082390.m01.CDS01 n=1 Tax=Anthostomella pinea TaxID=933095 RepID=A0AAI8YJM6_9PEZI|nr:Uu.00g082390.m01.CDS01 [Anthostomella pinea]
MTTPTPQSILIIGAGDLGTAGLEGLVQHPSYSSAAQNPKIAILLRPATINTADAAKQRQNAHLRTLGAVLQPGDVVAESEADRAALFGRFEVVIGCSDMGLPAGTQVRITRAVLLAAAGVGGKRLTRYFPWQWGLDYDVVGEGSAQDLFDEQLAVRGLLQNQHRKQKGEKEGERETEWTGSSSARGSS